jgi:hypothetical protein
LYADWKATKTRVIRAGTFPLSEKNTFSSFFLPKGKQICFLGVVFLPLGKEFLPLGKMQKKQPLSGNVPAL